MSNEYYVYVAKDSNDCVVYVGSGRDKRIEHVNSGRSHNPEINKHVITIGKLAVDKVAVNLSKDAALIEEQRLQDMYTPVYNKNKAVSPKKKLRKSDYKIALAVLDAEHAKLDAFLDKMSYEDQIASWESMDIQGLEMAYRYIEGVIK